MANHNSSNLPATIASPLDNFQRLADSEMTGTVLKFVKGRWSAGTSEVPMDAMKLEADVENLSVGWRKWVDAKIVDSDISRVADGFRQKERHELDDVDKSKWPIDPKTNQPQDPWQAGYYLRLIDEEGNAYLWSATSSGAKRAIGSLSRAFVHRHKRGQGGNPIIELRSDSYRHETFGRVDVPQLNILAWTSDAPKLSAPPSNDFDDSSIPF
jgi:hypothetical protein